MAESNSIDHVSDTAFWVAQCRVEESERPDALFKDPFAKILVGEKGPRILASMKATSSYTTWILAIRTCIIDRFIENLVSEGVDTVLNLGAGLDTRPYRMDLPKSLRWIEVDYPHMIEHKEKLLVRENPRVRLERVKLDLSDRPNRQEFFSSLNRDSKKTLVITEGVIPYLSETQVAELAEDLKSQPVFHFWIAEYFAPHVYPYLRGPKQMRQLRKAPFIFFPADWFGFFEAHGWVPHDIKYLSEESTRLKRGIPAPWWVAWIRPFVSKKLFESRQRFSAYVIYVKNTEGKLH